MLSVSSRTQCFPIPEGPYKKIARSCSVKYFLRVCTSSSRPIITDLGALGVFGEAFFFACLGGSFLLNSLITSMALAFIC